MSTATIDDTRAKDLDEVRRVCYMALLRPRTEKYELAATVVNALVHHQRVEEPEDQVIEFVLAAIDGDGKGSGTAWVRQQIDRISEELA